MGAKHSTDKRWPDGLPHVDGEYKIEATKYWEEHGKKEMSFEDFAKWCCLVPPCVIGAGRAASATQWWKLQCIGRSYTPPEPPHRWLSHLRWWLPPTPATEWDSLFKASDDGWSLTALCDVAREYPSVTVLVIYLDAGILGVVFALPWGDHKWGETVESAPVLFSAAGRRFKVVCHEAPSRALPPRVTASSLQVGGTPRSTGSFRLMLENTLQVGKLKGGCASYEVEELVENGIESDGTFHPRDVELWGVGGKEADAVLQRRLASRETGCRLAKRVPRDLAADRFILETAGILPEKRHTETHSLH